MRLSLSNIVLTVIGSFGVGESAFAADFISLGFLNPGNSISRISGLSSDGAIAVGESFQGEHENGGLFRWSANSGMSALVQAPSPTFSGAIEPNDWSRIKSVSGNGEVILFDRQTYGPLAPDGSRSSQHARYVWPAAGEVESPPPLIDAFVYFNALSTDGRRRAGSVSVDMYRYGGPNSHAAIIDANGSITGLGWLPGSQPRPPGGNGPMSEAIAMSADSSVVVGASTSTNAPGSVTVITLGEPIPPGQFSHDRYEAFVWSQTTGMVGLGDLPGGVFNSRANNVSPAGHIVIGTSSVEAGIEAFRWTAATGMQGLGFLNAELKQSAPSAVSNDGTIVGTSLIAREIVGYYEFTNIPIYENTLAAFIWDAEHGMRDLKGVLETDFGIDLAGWQLSSAVDISDDGLVIAGNGVNPLGQEEGWVVRLDAIPEPTSVVLVIAAGMCLAPFLRRRRGRRSR